MASRERSNDVADVAREARERGDLEGARRALRRLIRTEPSNPVWRLRLADVLEDRVRAHGDVLNEALGADAPLVALAAALAAGAGGLGVRFERYLQGSSRLGRGAPPQPPLPAPRTVPPELNESVPHWPVRHTTGPVNPMPLLSSLALEGFSAIVPALSRVQLSPGEVLLAEGATADAMFLVAGGELEVRKADDVRGAVLLGRLRAGSAVGEMALVLQRPRTATVRALVDTELIRIELDALRELATTQPAVQDALAAYTRERLLATLVGTSPLFADLQPTERGAVLWRFTHRDVAAGEVLVHEGGPSEGLFLVVEGQVAVHHADADAWVKVADLGPGKVFGEIALVHGGTAVATVVAETDAYLIVLDRRDFDALCIEFPVIRDRASALGTARLAENRCIFEDDEFIEAAD